MTAIGHACPFSLREGTRGALDGAKLRTCAGGHRRRLEATRFPGSRSGACASKSLSHGMTAPQGTTGTAPAGMGQV